MRKYFTVVLLTIFFTTSLQVYLPIQINIENNLYAKDE